MDAERIAQELADHFHPPYTTEIRKLPIKDYMHLPADERYEQKYVRMDGDSAAFTSFDASDGYKSVRGLTYREIVDALGELGYDVVKNNNEKENNE